MSVDPLAVSLDVTAIPVRAAGAGQYALALAAALDRRDDVAPTLVARRGEPSFDPKFEAGNTLAFGAD